MGVTLGTGVTLESFHAVGKEPDAIEVLNIRVIGSASSAAYSFQIRVGIPSGPGALKALMASSFLYSYFHIQEHICVSHIRDASVMANSVDRT